MLATLGLERVVLVQPSVYGTDNRCLLDGLRALGERARGVVVVGDEAGAEELRRLHAAGVRGVRLNAVSAGAPRVDRLAGQIRNLSRRIGPLGWHVQLYLPSKLLATLEPVLARLEVPAVVDHMADLPVAATGDREAQGSLLRLLASGRVWVKLSAPYRVPGAEDDPAALRALVRTMIEARPDRLLWGSDWPHTPPHPGAAKGPAPRQRFRPLDTGRLLDNLADWAPDDAARQLILAENPKRLYDFA
jgi:predicted TIM-barrel fold metal-dependent hydrolase